MLNFKSFRTNFVFVSGILLLFCFQQFILYYSLYYLKNVHHVLYTLILDIPLDMLLSFFGLYVTPIMYSLFNSASKSSLFQDRNLVTVDELLHSDLGLSTTIDLWDLILMFSHLLKYYKVEMSVGDSLLMNIRLFVVFIIFVLVTIFLFGLVIPAVDGDYKAEHKIKSNLFNQTFNFFIKLLQHITKKSGNSNTADSKKQMKNTWDKQDNVEYVLKSVEEINSVDMFTMAKFTFIIGFFLIDIPFLIYRLYILVKYNVFSLLLYKNFMFLFLRPYRLNMSQLAERDTTKGYEHLLFTQPISNSINTITHHTLSHSFQDDEDTEDLLKKYNKPDKKVHKSVFTPILSHKTIHKRDKIKSDPTPFSHTEQTNNTSGPNEKSGLFTSKSKLFTGKSKLFSGKSRLFAGKSRLFAGKSRLFTAKSKLFGEEKSFNFREKDRLNMMRMMSRTKLVPIKSYPFSLILHHLRKFLFPPREPKSHSGDEYGSNFPQFIGVKHFWCYIVVLFTTILPRILIVFLYSTQKIRSPREILHNLPESNAVEKILIHLLIVFPILTSVFTIKTCGITDSIFLLLREFTGLFTLSTCVCCLKLLLQTYKLYKHLYILLIFLTKPLIILIDFAIILINTVNHPRDYNNILFSLIYCLMSQSARVLMLRKYEVNYIVMRVMNLEKNEWDDLDSPENCITLAEVDKYINTQGLLSSPGTIMYPFL
eukprot:XP_763098.1 hypothetical protein [Theileria parva strain Muguga]